MTNNYLPIVSRKWITRAEFETLYESQAQTTSTVYENPNTVYIINEPEEPKPVKAEPYWRKFETRKKWR